MNYREWVILKQLTLLPKQKEISLTELANALRINRRDRPFAQLLKILFSSGSLTLTKTIGTAKLVTINKGKLAQLLKQAEVVHGNPFKHVQDYFHNSGLEKFYSGI